MKLAEDYKALEEVVVVGYGTMLKRNLSTSVGSVDSEKLLERPNATNVFQGLAGKVAGVNIALNSGAPGGSPAIKIRGIGSFEFFLIHRYMWSMVWLAWIRTRLIRILSSLSIS